MFQMLLGLATPRRARGRGLGEGKSDFSKSGLATTTEQNHFPGLADVRIHCLEGQEGICWQRFERKSSNCKRVAQLVAGEFNDLGGPFLLYTGLHDGRNYTVWPTALPIYSWSNVLLRGCLADTPSPPPHWESPVEEQRRRFM